MSILDFHVSMSNDHHTELASLSRLTVAQRLFEDDDAADWNPWS